MAHAVTQHALAIVITNAGCIHARVVLLGKTDMSVSAQRAHDRTERCPISAAFVLQLHGTSL